MPKEETSPIEQEWRRHIGQQIAKKRSEAGLSQAELGRRVGRTRGTVWNWENPDHPGRKAVAPGAAILHRIAEACGCTTDELTGGVEPPERNALELAFARLRKKALNWRIIQLSLLPGEKLRMLIDAALSAHNDAQERKISSED